MTFLRSILREKWRSRMIRLVSLYLLILLWPLLLFSKQIRFNPATFTQEWIKSVASVSIIFLILEYQKFIFESNRKKMFCKETLERKVINPLKEFNKSLLAIQALRQFELDKLLVLWSGIYNDLKTLDLYSFNISFENKKLFNFQKEFGLPGLNDKIMQYITPNADNDVQEITGAISAIITAFEKEIDNLK